MSATPTASKLPIVCKIHNKTCFLADGLLVVPVLQPAADNLPFGLALSLQSQVIVSQQPSSFQTGHDDDVFELQYVLEGAGQASTASRKALKSKPCSETCSWCCSCAASLDCCKTLQLETAFLLQWEGLGVSLLLMLLHPGRSWQC